MKHTEDLTRVTRIHELHESKIAFVSAGPPVPTEGTCNGAEWSENGGRRTDINKDHGHVAGQINGKINKRP